MEDVNLEDAAVREVVKGDIIKGKVVQITDDGVYLDIGAKVEGRIPITEFDYSPKLGDEIEVLVVKNNETQGEIELSKNRAEFIKIWNNIKEIYNDTGYISGRIIKKLSNGYEVDIGIPGFLPFSQIKKVKDIKEIKDKPLMFKILRLDNRRKKVILSRKEYIKETTEKRKQEIFSNIKEGDIIEGIVKNITNFGVFVDLGGVDALIPQKELSWKRFVSPDDVVVVNQKIKGMVMLINKEKERIVLSHKNTLPNPWSNIEERYQIGMIAKGKIVEIKDYGVFVELEEGIDGFINLDNLTWAKHTKKPNEIVSIGDEVNVKILDIDKINKKIKLGLKQVLPNPWDKIGDKYNVGQKVKVKVKKITGTGAYAEIENDKEIEGFIELAEVSWTKKYNHGREAFKKGQPLTAVVLDIDKSRNLLKLGLRQLETNPWHLLKEKVNSNKPVDCVVQKVVSRGAYVLIDKKMEGFIPLSHFAERKIENPKKYLRRGEKLRCLVLEIDEKKKRAILSLKEYRKMKIQEEMSKYIKKEPTEKMKLGDMIKFENHSEQNAGE